MSRAREVDPRNKWLKPLAAPRQWGNGRVCGACGVLAFHSRWTRYGHAASHLTATGKWVMCTSWVDPLYRCSCGNEKRSHTGKPPKGWISIEGIKATCAKCSRLARVEVKP